VKHTHSRSILSSAAPFLAAAALGGCATSQIAERPARINHIVFVKLQNPSDAVALIADCDTALCNIPGVTRYACGPHLETGRPTVINDYDVGIYIGFESEAAYSAYVDNPSHQGLVQAWAPKAQWLHVYDVVDETP
jgi:hypothetical protein